MSAAEITKLYMDIGDKIFEKKVYALYNLRNNVMLETNPLQELGFNFSTQGIDSLHEMSDSKNAKTLYDIGSLAAAIDVKENDLR